MRGEDGRDGREACCPRVKPNYPEQAGRGWRQAGCAQPGRGGCTLRGEQVGGPVHPLLSSAGQGRPPRCPHAGGDAEAGVSGRLHSALHPQTLTLPRLPPLPLAAEAAVALRVNFKGSGFSSSPHSDTPSAMETGAFTRKDQRSGRRRAAGVRCESAARPLKASSPFSAGGTWTHPGAHPLCRPGGACRLGRLGAPGAGRDVRTWRDLQPGRPHTRGTPAPTWVTVRDSGTEPTELAVITKSHAIPRGSFNILGLPLTMGKRHCGKRNLGWGGMGGMGTPHTPMSSILYFPAEPRTAPRGKEGTCRQVRELHALLLEGSPVT